MIYEFRALYLHGLFSLNLSKRPVRESLSRGTWAFELLRGQIVQKSDAANFPLGQVPVVDD